MEDDNTGLRELGSAADHECFDGREVGCRDERFGDEKMIGGAVRGTAPPLVHGLGCSPLSAGSSERVVCDGVDDLSVVDATQVHGRDCKISVPKLALGHH